MLRYVAVVVVALTAASTMATFVGRCGAEHPVPTAGAAGAACCSAGEQTCCTARPQANTLRHEKGPDGCACSVGTPTAGQAWNLSQTRVRSAPPAVAPFSLIFASHRAHARVRAPAPAMLSARSTPLSCLRTVVLLT
jgi:hypothetical protein